MKLCDWNDMYPLFPDRKSFLSSYKSFVLRQGQVEVCELNCSWQSPKLCTAKITQSLQMSP